VPEELTPPLEVPVSPRREPAWGYAELALVVVSFFLTLMLCGIAAFAIARKLPLFHGLSQLQITTSPFFFIPVQMGAYLLTYVVARFTVAAKSGENFWKAIRWELPATEECFRFALLGVLLALTVQVLSAFLPFPKALPMYEYFREVRLAYVMAAFGLLVAPIAEEIFFRGLFFPVVARTGGAVVAVLVTGAIFSFMHRTQLAWSWGPMLVLFGVGVVLTVVRARTKSVAASWITHVAYNGTLFALLFYFSDGFQALAK
jgi:uncharacterized protein